MGDAYHDMTQSLTNEAASYQVEMVDMHGRLKSAEFGEHVKVCLPDYF